MRAVYVYDLQTKEFLYPRVFEDNDNTVIPNSTTVPVPDNLWGKKYFDVDKQEWHGMTKEEYLKANPPKPTPPTATQEMLNALGSQVAKGSQDITISQKMLNALGQQVAQVTQENTQMKSMINTLGQQVAQLTSEKGGN